MSTLALIMMLIVQLTVTVITAWFLIRTFRKTNNKHQQPNLTQNNIPQQ